MTARCVVTIAAALVFALACATDGVILERADVQSFEVVQSPPSVAKQYSLRITGVVGHSGLAFSRHREFLHGDTLEVLVDLVPAQEGTSGNFDFVVFVPIDVTHVVFGDQRAPIWRRP